MQGWGKREIPEKARRPAASSGTIPTCENPGPSPPGIEPGSRRWEAIWSGAGRVGRGKREIPEKTHRPATSSGTIPTIPAPGVERLTCLPPTKANRVQSLVGSLQDFRKWESCRTMPLVGGSSRGVYRFLTLLFRRCSLLTSITLSLDFKTSLGYTTRFPPRRTRFDSRRSRAMISACENRAGRCRWSKGLLGDSLFPRPFIPALLHTHKASPSSTPKSSILRAAQISGMLVMGSDEGNFPRDHDYLGSRPVLTALDMGKITHGRRRRWASAGNPAPSPPRRHVSSRRLWSTANNTCAKATTTADTVHTGCPKTSAMTGNTLRCITWFRLLASHRGEPGSISGRFTPDFLKWESCRTMPLVGGFSRGSNSSPAFSFRRCSVLTLLHPPIGS
ncbi:hypothetical protein PR048_014436 [Dryococelus australis]|uniref:Uncharacterized protein n=1 Tax=Dryococelus australis TaxID=614101 RepID=A0ABQ9HEE5_9NEOP|nr:hypothetical protein PR048_014436 [Dryococelus australis]